MPVRKLTQQEIQEWLGSGIVVFGQKPPSWWPKNSENSSQEQPQESASIEASDDDPPPADEQEAFDREMAKLTPEQHKAMIKGIAELARSKFNKQ